MRSIVVAITILVAACAPDSPPKPALHPAPESPAPTPEAGLCDRAVDNLIRLGAFRLAEIDSPAPGTERSIFCEVFENEGGYDLECVAGAKSLLDLGKCKFKCSPDGGSCK